MTSLDGETVIIFNGAIYNFLELRDELERMGHRFRTDSDTEVILNAYEQWGIDCQQRLNGMWAFAIWDNKRRHLFLSRDRIGEKPLHYAIFQNSFVFGSEIKALLAWGIPAVARDDLLEIYLTLGYIPAPHSFYRHIRKLRPAHYLLVKEGRIEERKYWHFPQVPECDMVRGEKAVCEQFESILSDSVRLRMRSDVPYGAFLSGGLDSSSIVSLMAQHSEHPVETFTIGFKEGRFDERGLARQAAAAFRSHHHEHLVDSSSFDDSIESILHHYDEPFGDDSAIPTGHLARFARQYVKVALTGDGGDEVLSGYTIYQGEKFAADYKRLPTLLQRSAPPFARWLGRPFHGAMRYRMNRIAKVCAASAQSFELRLTAKLAKIPPIMIRNLLVDRKDVWPFREFLAEVMRDCTFSDPFSRLMYFQFLVSLPDQMLTKVDRMSMACALEARAPFLDYRLVEFMAGVHRNVKMPGYRRKSVLLDSIGRRLPESIRRAPKRGFSVPLSEWFRGEDFRSRVASLADGSLPFAPGQMRSIIDETTTGKQDSGAFLWMLFLLKVWRERNC